MATEGVIKNFGIHWQKDDVFWGSGSVPGHLIGKGKNGREVDFREQVGVYILCDRDFQPLYVGQAGKGGSALLNRLRYHRGSQHWNRWDYFSWFGFRGINKDNTLRVGDGALKKYGGSGIRFLDEIEGVLIQAMEPRFNRQGPRWKGVEEFEQIQPEDGTSNDDILKELAKIQFGMERLTKRLDKLDTFIKRLS